MGVSFDELRRVCQSPVRGRNDVAGLLMGDRASLPITKVFVDFGLSPDYATLGMLAAGILGSIMLGFGGVWAALLGALLLLLYYVLDCVDGEVARFRGIENMKWGYYDFLFHMLVKPCTFLGVGIGLWRVSDNAWFLLFAATALTSTLWLKMFLDTPVLLFTKTVLAGKPGQDRSFRRFFETLDLELDEVEADDKAGATNPFPLGINLVTLRALMTNFDIGLVFLVLATLLDATVAPEIFGVGARGAWLAYYGVVLPLDFFDYMRSYIPDGHFSKEVRRLLRLSHRFDIRPLYTEQPTAANSSSEAAATSVTAAPSNKEAIG